MSDLTRARLRQLLDQVVRECDHFVTNFEDELPVSFIPREILVEAAQCLHDLGLTRVASLLIASCNATFNAFMDVGLCDLARGQSAEYQEWLEEIFGQYPQPADDDETHEELQRDRRLMVAGRVSTMAEYIRGIQKTLASQFARADAVDQVPPAVKTKVSTFGDLLNAVDAETKNIEYVESDGDDRAYRAYCHIQSRCNDVGGETTEALHKLRDVVCTAHQMTEDDANRTDLVEFAQLLRRASDDAGAERNNDKDHRFVFARDGDGYYIEAFGERRHFEKLLGLRVLERLLQDAGEPVLMRKLVADDSPESSNGRRASSNDQNLDRVDQDQVDDDQPSADELKASWESQQDALDQETIDSTNKRVVQIDAEITAAEDAGDWKKVDELEAERKELERYVAASLGIGRKPRDINSLVNKLRTRIRGQLRTVYERLEKATQPMSATCDHFKRNVKAAGSAYIYDPPKAPSWVFRPTKPPVRSNLTE